MLIDDICIYFVDLDWSGQSEPRYQSELFNHTLELFAASKYQSDQFSSHAIHTYLSINKYPDTW